MMLLVGIIGGILGMLIIMGVFLAIMKATEIVMNGINHLMEAILSE